MKKIMGALLVFVCLLFGTSVTAETTNYELTPTVHQITYNEGLFAKSANGVKLFFKGDIDEVTKDRTRELLTAYDITYEEITELNNNQDKLIIIGTKSDDDTQTVFNHFDSYILSVTENKIEIIGKNTDAAFYALATLDQILSQSEDGNIRQLVIEDYADVKYRGFIEGYYGIPWSHENRISLMNFGGQFKANTYIFAPKDDIYHSSRWRDLYPETELTKIRELVATGKTTKTRFVWTIHPFMSSARFNFNQYDTDYAALVNKFEQLYNEGVRQFGILADDVGQINRDQLLRLLNDISAWAKAKGDVEDILFCPAGYNHSWQGDYAELKKLNEAPDNIQFFWTGDTVVGKITQAAVDRFRNGTSIPTNTTREPYFWLNWPVNDYKKSRLLMGPATVLEPGVEHLVGVVTNPMQQAQASKVGIFATVDYAWNTRDFNAQNNWEQSFSYIDETGADSLKEMAKHLQDVSPSGHGLVLAESSELAPKLQQFSNRVANEESILSLAPDLISEYQKLYKATQDYSRDGENELLKAELEPWRQQLADLSKANEHFIKALVSLENGDKDSAWTNYSTAVAHSESAKTHKVQNLTSLDVVESGAKHIMPFTNVLKQKLSDKLARLVLPQDNMITVPTNTIIKSNEFNSIYQGSEGNLTDGDVNNHVWYNISGNSVPAGVYIGLDLGDVFKIGQISFLQGTASNSDIFSNAILEYSVDGVTYQPFRTEPFNDKDVTYNAESSNVSARYVRLRNGNATGKWAAFREISVHTLEKPTKYLYTNVNALKETVTNKEDNTFTLSSLSNISLKPQEFIGLDLQRIRQLKNITVEKSDTVKVFAGDNKDFLTEVTGEIPQTARYIVVKNVSNQDQTVNVSRFNVETADILPMKVVRTNYTSVENPLAAFDGNTGTPAWLKNSQHAGKYIVYDLGQTVTLNHISQVVADSEHDYIRHGKISVSADDVNYTDVLTLGDETQDLDISGVYPDRNVQLLSKSATVDNLPVRYVKVEITKDKSGADKWTRFNEIILNKQTELPASNNPTFVTTPAVKNADRAEFAIDGDLNTAFRGSDDGGTLIYNLSDTAYYDSFTVLQSETVSNAKVSVKHHDGTWEEIGILDKGLKVFDFKQLRDVVSVKIEWESGKSPVIYEMYGTSGINRVPLQDIIQRVEKLVATDYANGFDSLTVELNSAKELLKSDTLTQEEVDNAVKKLDEKIKALVPYKQIELNGFVIKTAGTQELENVTLRVEKIKDDALEMGTQYEGYKLILVNANNEPITVKQPMTITLPLNKELTFKNMLRRINGQFSNLTGMIIADNNKSVAIQFVVDELSEYGIIYNEQILSTESTATETSSEMQSSIEMTNTEHSIQITSDKNNGQSESEKGEQLADATYSNPSVKKVNKNTNNLPLTGDNSLILVGVGVLLLVLAVFVIFKNKKSK